MMTGEGGITLCKDAKMDKYGRQVINHGREGHSTHTVLGYNYRLTNLAAAIGIAQLEQLEGWIAKRNANAAALSKAFEGLSFIKTPSVPKGCRHVFHQYTVRVKASEREKFMKYLADNGVGSGIYYPTVMYKQPYYKKLGYKSGLCPEAEKAAKEVVSLPVHPMLSKDDVTKIIDVVKGYKK
jgi:dTDP-4-amino-4,6-dideoxygalactose transaminase